LRYSKLSKAVLAACAVATCATAPAQRQSAQSQQVEEILVTGRRSGIPIWHVHGPTTSIVLVGTIDGVTKDTKWDPAALVEALRKSDRVMYPGTYGLTASPFAMIGWLVKFKRQASLPNGQTLANFLPPDQFAQLVALQKRGILKPGFERKHPLHLAMDLRDYAEGKGGYAPRADSYVQKAVKKYKLKSVPITSGKAKPFVNDLLASPPESHVPCLIDSIGVAEAGPGAVQARSRAWAERRVAAVLASPAQKPFLSCWPANVVRNYFPKRLVQNRVRELLNEPQVTVAVLDLYGLTRPGGMLDELAAAGFDVAGPRWK
jgi:uncharacterized protein YbaP (TraB family)